MSGLDRQQAIYRDGVSGRRPKVTTDAAGLEAQAREVMSERGFAYIAGGAGTEATIAANRSDFDRWRIVPRMMVDVGKRDTGIELLGAKHASPFILSPIGVLEMAHREADVAVARAAAEAGVPMTISNQASTPMETIAETLGDSARFFQLYWSSSNELVESLVSRAETIGASALVLTLDTTMLGWRTKDLDLGHLPFLHGMGIAQYTSDPVFDAIISDPPPELAGPKPRVTAATLRTLYDLAKNYPDQFMHGLRSGKAREAAMTFTRIYSRPSLTWSDLAFLRERTKLPIVLKGILHADDARRAIDEGVDGIWVTNHGGRQVDGSISSIAALPAVAEAVAGRAPIIIDSGIRSGADAFKALALGATAIGIGRPYCYGLAIAGQDGVREVLENFKADFDLTMGLSGYRSIGELSPDALVPAPG